MTTDMAKREDGAPALTQVKDLSSIRRLPRIGKIRLGEKRVSKKSGAEYPVELHYFRFDPEALEQYPAIRQLYGDKPTELDVFLPSEDPAIFFKQSRKLYGLSGLRCKGDGERALRAVCEKCGAMSCKCDRADRIMREVPCPCELKAEGACRPVGSLMVLLPRVSVGGCWQIDTGSWNSIVDLNSGIEYVRGLCGRVSLVPLKLRRVPRQMQYQGKASTHYTLQLVFDQPLDRVLAIQQAQRPSEYLIESPHDDGDERPALPAPEAESGGPDPSDEDEPGKAASPPAELPISTDQKLAIGDAARALGWKMKRLYEECKALGLPDVKDMTEPQASRLVKALEQRPIAARPTPPAEGGCGIPEPDTILCPKCGGDDIRAGKELDGYRCIKCGEEFVAE